MIKFIVPNENVLGAYHAGFDLKERLREALEQSGREVVDLGACGPESTDHPDYAAAVTVPGIRAALGTNEDEVRLSRAHNDSNALTIGARYTDVVSAGALVEVLLTADLDGGRHARRIAKITAREQEQRTVRGAGSSAVR